MQSAEFKRRVRRAEDVLQRRLLQARRWHNETVTHMSDCILDNNCAFEKVYIHLSRELRPEERVNMACVYELISEKLFSNRHDAILAMYPAF